MSHNQLPPPPPHYDHGQYDQGPFEGVTIMNHPDDDSDRRGNMDMFDELFPNNNNKSKKNGLKNAFDMKKPVATRYEGFIVQRAPAKSLKDYSWENCTQQRMPYEQSAILEIAERHRQKDPKLAIHDHFRRLSTKQQNAINTLIEELRDNETQKNADWIIYDVYAERTQGGMFSRPEIKRIQVIFKRIDKTQTSKLALQTIKDGKDKNSISKDKSTGKKDGIFDVNESGKKNKNKETANSKQKLKRSNSYGDLPDPMAALGLAGFDSGPQNNHSRHNSQQQDFGLPPPPPHGHIPHGAIPVNPQMPPAPPGFYSTRQQSNDSHPFAPFDGVPAPIRMDSPQFNEPGWPHPHGHNHRRRSHSLNRRPSIKRSRTDSQMRDMQAQMRETQDQIQDLALAVQRTHISDERDRDRVFDSDDSWPEDGSTFSRNLSPTRSWTPPSSPRSHFSDLRARGSLERRRSSKYRPRYRSGWGRESVDVIPAYSSYSHRRSEDFSSRPSRRMSLPRAITYDDYPVRAPEPPTSRAMQRRYSEYDRGSDYRDRDWGRDRRGSRYETVEEEWEPRRGERYRRDRYN